MEKIVLGMSGGVDSSAAAAILSKEYEVYGVTLRMQGDCFASDEAEDARRVAEKLGIKFDVIDCEKIFGKSVKDYFAAEYMNGRTPNPCIACNRFVKWAKLLEYADSIGAAKVATGHYADIVRAGERYTLKNTDNGKDQTYALYMLSQEQLKRTVMPLGGYTKEEVRRMAAELGLSVADKPDSMEICFVTDNDYAGYVEGHTGNIPPHGNFVDTEGNILGEHKGITHYTVGQRKGLGIAFGVPMFVKEIRSETNEVVLCPNEELFTKEISVGGVNFLLSENAEKEIRAIGRIRYGHKGAECSIMKNGSEKLKVVFDVPVRAAAPGQSFVAYDSEGRVLLGGVIEQADVSKRS